jgi:3-deoxy-D-manno-octulosonic-acid transferase
MSEPLPSEAEAMAATPLTLRAYRAAASALEPIAPFALRRRALRGKEDGARMAERLGRTPLLRPGGELVWIHGASLGECTSVLPLIDKLLETPNRSVLMTSVTVTSAGLDDRAASPRAFHQYAPVDTPASVARFLDHWRPDIGLFVDSEIWPNTLAGAHALGIPLALINGRMSACDPSRAGAMPRARPWRSCRSTIFASPIDDETASSGCASWARRMFVVSGQPEGGCAAIARRCGQARGIASRIAGGPVLLASSTHPAKTKPYFPPMTHCARDRPDLLTIIVPRHPERGRKSSRFCAARRVATRRSEGRATRHRHGDLRRRHYRRARPVLPDRAFRLCGRQSDAAGRTQSSGARALNCGVLAGPNTANFTQAYNTIFAEQGAGRVTNCAEIVALAGRLLNNPADARALGDAAARGAALLGGAEERTRLAIESLLASHAHA